MNSNFIAQLNRSASQTKSILIKSNYVDYIELISKSIDNLIKVVEEYIHVSGKECAIELDDIKHQIYSLIFNTVINNFKPADKRLVYSQRTPSKSKFEKFEIEKSIVYNHQQGDTSNVNTIITELNKYMYEFKTETLSLIVSKPSYSMFDFAVSQNFNDFWDVLSTAQQQLNQGLSDSTGYHLKPSTLDQSFELYRYKDEAFIRSSRSEQKNKHRDNLVKLQVNTSDNFDYVKTQNLHEIEFVLTQQFLYEFMKDKSTEKLLQCCRFTKKKLQQSPVKHNPKFQTSKHDFPQLFSFDSSFVKDLPLKSHFNISNFDKTLANISDIEEETIIGLNESKDQKTSRFVQEEIKPPVKTRSKLEEQQWLIEMKEKELISLQEDLDRERLRLEEEFSEFDQMREEFEMYKDEEMEKIRQAHTRLQLLQLSSERELKENDSRRINKIRSEKPLFLAPETLGFVKGKIMVNKKR